MLGSGTTALIMPNEEIENIVKIIKFLQYSGLLLKEVCETIQNEAKEYKGGFLSMLLGALGTSLWGNMLAGKGMNRAGGFIRAANRSKRSSIKDF